MISNFESAFKTIYISSLLVALTFNSFAVGDQQEYKISTGNTTTIFVWTLGSEQDHILHCIATGDPLPSLKWAYGIDRQEFLGNETIHVDTTNKTDIVMTFKTINYTIINEFYCLGLNSAGITSEATVDILVSPPKSNWVSFWWIVFVAIFLVVAVVICRRFKFNDYAVELEK